MTLEQQWVAEFRAVADMILPRKGSVTITPTTIGMDAAIQITPTDREGVEHGAWGFGKVVPASYDATTCYNLLVAGLSGEKGVEVRTAVALGGGLKP